jgi:adenylate cyclase class 2
MQRPFPNSCPDFSRSDTRILKLRRSSVHLAFPYAAILDVVSSPNEIEIKFRIDHLESLSSRLRQLGFEQVTPRTHELNTLYDLRGRPLRARGDLLRLRKYGETWVLTHKAKSNNQEGPHKTRVETETRVEDGQKMETILRALQFEPVFRYEKFRAEWKDEHGHVVIDETPIGNFGEIEGPSDWIDSIAKQLNVHRQDYITETYAGLFFHWKKKTNSSAQEMTFEAVKDLRA